MKNASLYSPALAALSSVASIFLLAGRASDHLGDVTRSMSPDVTFGWQSKLAKKNTRIFRTGLAPLGLLVLLSAGTASAASLGFIYACYGCLAPTGIAAADAALQTPGLPTDGIMFVFVNPSNVPIGGSILSVANSGASGDMTIPVMFHLPIIDGNSTYILIPGISNDGLSHVKTSG